MPTHTQQIPRKACLAPALPIGAAGGVTRTLSWLPVPGEVASSSCMFVLISAVPAFVSSQFHNLDLSSARASAARFFRRNPASVDAFTDPFQKSHLLSRPTVFQHPRQPAAVFEGTQERPQQIYRRAGDSGITNIYSEDQEEDKGEDGATRFRLHKKREAPDQNRKPRNSKTR